MVDENSTAEQFDWGNQSSNYIPYERRPETYIVPVLFTLIFVIGSIGNGVLVFIFLRHKSMRNIPNTFIICLAIGDLFVIIGTVPFIGVIYAIESWPFGIFVCKASEFFRDMSTTVSVFTLTLLSIDRYFAIAMPLQKTRGKQSMRITTISAASIWLVAIIFALPAAYNSHLIEYSTGVSKVIKICFPFPSEYGNWYPKTVVMSKFLILYTIPLTIIAISYCLMAMSLLQSRRFPTENSPRLTRQFKSRTKVAKMVLALVLIFALCYFPNHVFMLWFYFTYPRSLSNYNDFWHLLKIIGYVLTFLNSCLNPIALYYISGRFRAYFRRYIFCRLKSVHQFQRSAQIQMTNSEDSYKSTSNHFSASSKFNSTQV
ncbi:[Phe13]-bombesin receptor-like protein [Dinothrombium tinctorium]|uniref:[Phe13]-bombesin receptor-like protein n=1 Tax=Dinothrombium tinctorium TaxID=1965070 RepID=A0A443QQU3_9ACAR|nr:[Phe13]-bombesin receptor-like protein [Dinothrombium tinctorium]RWS07145.1 [Phe13]-bombesin receptor-like protein [Dinothrombium tinctorium]